MRPPAQHQAANPGSGLSSEETLKSSGSSRSDSHLITTLRDHELQARSCGAPGVMLSQRSHVPPSSAQCGIVCALTLVTNTVETQKALESLESSHRCGGDGIRLCGSDLPPWDFRSQGEPHLLHSFSCVGEERERREPNQSEQPLNLASSAVFILKRSPNQSTTLFIFRLPGFLTGSH